MSDPALQWLLETLKRQAAGASLWCVDENADNTIYNLPVAPNLKVISNRWDIATPLSQQGWCAEFSDFDLRRISTESLDHFFYRISKEKAVAHHLLNEAWRCLKAGGKLYLCGQKNEGIKTYVDKISERLANTKSLQKWGSAYVAVLEKKTQYDPNNLLDSSDYLTLRPLVSDTGLQLLSKPGQFGWNKFDQGSAFLIDALPGILERETRLPQSCLDLGCGYGYLTLMANQLATCQSIIHWQLTDNNAAAIRSAEANVTANHLNAQVIAANCADGINNKVDLLLCNPPFHQGFTVENELTDRFLSAARRLITQQGLAVFVVNQFIPLEKKATSLFRDVRTFANNGSFKLVVLKA